MLTQKGCLILGPRLTLSSITLALPGEAASEGIIPGYIAFLHNLNSGFQYREPSRLFCPLLLGGTGKKVLAHYSRES